MGETLAERRVRRVARASTACRCVDARAVADPGRRGRRRRRGRLSGRGEARGDAIAHKTERGLVRLGLADADAVRAAATRPARGGAARRRRRRRARRADGPRHARARRRRAPRRAVRAVRDGRDRRRAHRSARPTSPSGSCRSTRSTRTRCSTSSRRQALLGPVRGEPAVDRDAVRDVLLALCARSRRPSPASSSVDVNPLVVDGGRPVGGRRAGRGASASNRARPALRAARHRRGGRVRAIPGSSGSWRCTTSSLRATRARCTPTNLEGGELLGLPVATSVDDLPAGVPSTSCSCARRRARTTSSSGACARQGVRAAFVASAGYGEAGADGRARPGRARRPRRASSASLLAGPNGQGVVSTPASLCAQIVAPYPPPGRIGIVEPVGQLRVVVPEPRGRTAASG